MTVFRLEYPLVDGYVDNWLVAGPQVEAVEDVARFADAEDVQLAVAQVYYRRVSEVHEQPVEYAKFMSGEAELRWRYYRCQEDHQVDHSAVYASLYHLRSWAYAQVVAPAAQGVTFVLATFGPADVWVNGQHVHRQELASRLNPIPVSFDVELAQGPNEVLVRFEQVAVRDSPHAISLRVLGLPASAPLPSEQILDRRAAFTPKTGQESWDQAQVLLPIESAYTLRFQMLERVFEQAIVERRVHYKGDNIILRWPDDLEARAQYHGQIQDSQEHIYLEMLPEAQPGETVDLGYPSPSRLWERAYDVVLRPRPEEWYDYKLHYEWRIPIQVLDTEYSEELYGTYAQRRAEALQYAVARGADVYAEIAKMELGRWEDLDGDRLSAVLAQIARREAGSAAWLLGSLGVLYRRGDDPAFPADLASEVEAQSLGFTYEPDGPGLVGLSSEGEGESILLHAAELLAGQRSPEATFAVSGQTGAWHREHGEANVLAWLRQRGQYGFLDWNSGVSFEQMVVALSHLVELAENDQVQELSAVVLDKLLLSLALNSFKGAFGATQGRTGGVPVTSAQLQPTSGISRLLWGMGVWNAHVMGVVSLACSEYEMPLPVADVAVNRPDEVWQREHHGAPGTGVNVATYFNKSGLLSSAQDCRPGQPGSDEHIWQATLGPNAVVFVNHPATMSESAGRRPNCWAGNAVLPRVAQYKDTLISVHKLPQAGEGAFEQLTMTHAYLPVYEFDEYKLREGWCFVRKGSGFLALTAAQGIELVTRGANAYRELRSFGPQNVWLCHMGLWTAHSDFRSFQRKVLDLDLEWGDLSARCSTWRGDELSFGWDAPLTVNGKEQPLSGFKHYEGPYCQVELGAPEMEVRTRNYAMTLHFAEGE